MAMFIGGDTQTLEYDFGMKVSGSVAECPLKIYKQEVDPANLPSPTVTYTNLISNGDFEVDSNSDGLADGLTNSSCSTMSLSTDYFYTTKSQLLTTSGGTATYRYAYTTLSSLTVGSKYYVSVYCKTDNTSNSKLLAISSGTVLGYKYAPATNAWNKLSFIFTATATSADIRMYAEDSTGVAGTSKYDGLIVANLTSTFGVGNEPVQTWCDTYLPFVLSTGTAPNNWTEITSQTILDKLKTQNELTVSSIASDKSTVTWNGKTLPKTSTLKVTDDFLNKVSGDTTANPHKAIGSGSYSVPQTPSSLLGLGEVSTGRYGQLYNLSDSSIWDCNSVGTGNIAQSLFSFDIISMIERKFGSIPKETLAEKVAWAKSNISQVTFNAYVYGNSPLGNNAYVSAYTGTWRGALRTLTGTTPTNNALGLQFTGDWNNGIQSDGFYHFLAYTDQARVTDSTLLVMTGHGLSSGDMIKNVTRGSASSVSSVPSSNVAILYSSISSQVAGDTINKYHYTVTKTAEAGTTSTTVKITSHGLSTGDWICNNTRYGTYTDVTVVDANTFTCNNAITGQTSSDSIKLLPLLGTQTAESTVIPSTIYTDYVSLELTLKAPEQLITATNTLSDIVTDFSGKVQGDLNSNANIGKYQYNSALATPSNAYWNELASYSNINTLNGVSDNRSVSTNGYISQQLFSFNIVSAVEKALGQSIPAVDKVQWCKDFVNTIACNWVGYGSCPSGNKAYLSVFNVDTSTWRTVSLVGGYDYNNYSTPYSTTLSFTNSGNRIDSNGMCHFLAYTDQSDGITASTIFTDYVKLTIKLKYIPTYDFFTDSNQRRDAGLTDIVLVKRTIGDMTSDFSGKVSGSVVENPNICKWINAPTSLKAPTDSWNEVGNSTYTAYSTLNGVKDTISLSGNGQIAQTLFQFNLIEIAQRALGTSIPGADTPTKVQWLKDNINTITCAWTGYGSKPGGNKAYLGLWYNSAWVTMNSNTSSSATTISSVSDHNGADYVSPMIGSDGFANYLVYTDASDGTTPSVINTDYVKLTLTFKSDTVGYEYFTSNSAEISVTTSNKASAYLIECDLTPIANSLYGSSNNALKSALKSIQADVYAMGSGANVNQLGYGVKVYEWASGGSVWGLGSGSFMAINNPNTNSSIIKTSTGTGNQADSAWFTTNSNKLYYLVTSAYKSDGAISSEVNLDYVNIKVGLTRVPDVISNPPSINLTNNWSVLLRGVAPSYDNLTDMQNKYVLSLYKDVSNQINLHWRGANGGWRFEKTVGGVYSNAGTIANTVYPFSKYQVTNMLIEQNANGMAIRTLCNNGSVIKYSNTNTSLLTGSVTLYPLSNINSDKADAFVGSIVYLPNQTFDDTTAEAILRGTQSGYEFPELFDINAVTLHANATRSNGVITLNATNTWQESYLDIPILPNNKYIISGTRNVSDDSAWISITQYYNNIALSGNYENRTNNSPVFTTLPKANKIRVHLMNTSTSPTGTFTFSNISLKMQM